jgi:hypothetical protein
VGGRERLARSRRAAAGDSRRCSCVRRPSAWDSGASRLPGREAALGRDERTNRWCSLNENEWERTNPSGGSLGSRVDEERSKLRDETRTAGRELRRVECTLRPGITFPGHVRPRVGDLFLAAAGCARPLCCLPTCVRRIGPGREESFFRTRRLSAHEQIDVVGRCRRRVGASSRECCRLARRMGAGAAAQAGLIRALAQVGVGAVRNARCGAIHRARCRSWLGGRWPPINGSWLLLHRPRIGREYPLNLSISLSGGKETNEDSLSNGERSGKSPSPNRRGAPFSCGLVTSAGVWSVGTGPLALPRSATPPGNPIDRAQVPSNGATAQRGCQARRRGGGGASGVPESRVAWECSPKWVVNSTQG